MFTDWLAANGVNGLIGEVGWPSENHVTATEADKWAALGETMYRAFDAAGLRVTQWTTGEWWPATYESLAYRSSAGASGTVDTRLRAGQTLEARRHHAVAVLVSPPASGGGGGNQVATQQSYSWTVETKEVAATGFDQAVRNLSGGIYDFAVEETTGTTLADVLGQYPGNLTGSYAFSAASVVPSAPTDRSVDLKGGQVVLPGAPSLTDNFTIIVAMARLKTLDTDWAALWNKGSGHFEIALRSTTQKFIALVANSGAYARESTATTTTEPLLLIVKKSGQTVTIKKNGQNVTEPLTATAISTETTADLTVGGKSGNPAGAALHMRLGRIKVLGRLTTDAEDQALFDAWRAPTTGTEPISPTDPTPPADTTPPATPLGAPVAEYTAGRILLAGTANTVDADLAAQPYIWQRSLDAGVTFVELARTAAPSLEYAYVQPLAAETHRYRYRLVDKAGNLSGTSPEAILPIGADEAPSPIPVTANAIGTTINATWSPSLELDFKEYRVYTASAATPTAFTLRATVTNPLQTGVAVQGLAAGDYVLAFSQVDQRGQEGPRSTVPFSIVLPSVSTLGRLRDFLRNPRRLRRLRRQ